MNIPLHVLIIAVMIAVFGAAGYGDWRYYRGRVDEMDRQLARARQALEMDRQLVRAMSLDDEAAGDQP